MIHFRIQVFATFEEKVPNGFVEGLIGGRGRSELWQLDDCGASKAAVSPMMDAGSWV